MKNYSSNMGNKMKVSGIIKSSEKSHLPAISLGYHSVPSQQLTWNQDQFSARRFRLDLYRFLRDNIPVLNSCIWTWSRLSSAPGKFEIINAGNDAERMAAEEYLDHLSLRVYPYRFHRMGGLESFLPLLFSSLFTDGAFAGFVIINSDCSGIDRFVPIDPAYLSQADNKNSDHLILQTDDGDITIDGDDFYYFGLNTDIRQGTGNSILGAIPFIAYIEQQLVDDMRRTAHNAGYHRLHVKITPPEKMAGESDTAYVGRVNQYFDDTVGMIKECEPDDNPVTWDNVKIEYIGPGNVRSVGNTWFLNHRAMIEEICSGTNLAPFMLGYSYGTTHNWAQFKFDLVMRQVISVQRQTARFLEWLGNMELALKGSPCRCRYQFDNSLSYLSAEKAEIENGRVDNLLKSVLGRSNQQRDRDQKCRGINIETIFSRADWRRAVRDIPFFAEKFLDIIPHPGQMLWLANSDKAENLLVTGNRWGKSYVSAIKIIHHAIFRIRELHYDRSIRYRIVTASITQDQARIIFDTVLRILNHSCRIEGLIKKVTMTPYPRILLGNGAMIEARSTQRRGEYLLGNDYDYFIYDEVAFDYDAEYVVNEVIKMRLADRKGRLDLVSTPNGKNWFYRKMRELRDRSSDAYVQDGDSRENQYISSEYLQMQMKYLSDKRVAQNIMGQFVDSGGEIIPGKYIDAALEPIADEAGDICEDKGDVFYISGWDLARKKTATVGITVEFRGGIGRVAALSRIKKWDWNIIIAEIRNRQYQYPGRLVIDATGLGDVVVSQLADLAPTAFIFTAKSKAELLTNLELFHNMGKIKYGRWEIPDDEGRIWSLEDELRSARWDDNNQCDSLMALALALWPMHKPERPNIAPRISTI